VFGEVVVFWRMATPENGFCCVLVCFCCMNRGGVIYPFSLSLSQCTAMSRGGVSRLCIVNAIYSYFGFCFYLQSVFGDISIILSTESEDCCGD